MKRALISVTNKDGIVEFAKGLEKLGFEICAFCLSPLKGKMSRSD